MLSSGTKPPGEPIPVAEKTSSGVPASRRGRRARVGAALVFPFLAFTMALFILPAMLHSGVGRHRSPSAVLLLEGILVFMVVGPTLSLFEGVRGLGERRSGAIAAVTFSTLWLLVFFLVFFGWWIHAG